MFDDDGLVGIVADTVDPDALFAIDSGRRDDFNVFGGATDLDVGGVDYAGDVFDELRPGFLPFRGFPVDDAPVVRVTVSS